ncbi:MAG: hypothetical protein HYW47_02455 [Deltaproteobacteria bacterium]|nr:hypothetical protein [Deltaproteobacteria bacterium]
MKNFFVIFAIFLFSSSCSVQKMAVRQTAGFLTEAAPAFEKEFDLDLAEEAIPANLMVMEGLLHIDPLNPDLLLLLSKGFGGYAFSFLENKMEIYEKNLNKYHYFKKRAQDTYRRARDYALKHLSKEEAFKKALSSDFETFENSLKIFGGEEVPFLFWAGYNWGNLVNVSKENPEELADLSKAEALMRRVLQLDENYFYGSAHLFLGVFYGSRPPMLGGDFKKSKFHFEKALEVSQGRFLLASYMYARFYAVQTQDEVLFERHLRRVMKAKADILPEQRLANEMAKLRAQRALKQKGQFF